MDGVIGRRNRQHILPVKEPRPAPTGPEIPPLVFAPTAVPATPPPAVTSAAGSPRRLSPVASPTRPAGSPVVSPLPSPICSPAKGGEAASYRTKTGRTGITVALFRLIDAPGADPNAEWEGSIRSIKWLDQTKVTHNGCKGHYVHNICVYGLGDLEWLIQRDSLFANKFEVDNHPLVAECMERWLRRKTLSQSEVPIQPEWRVSKNKCFFDIEGDDCNT
ncbi:uncharacterized protein LOC116985293 [Amblyraja radiata]|uniref:uncharacterized protein LOC116985293 n=1 Tax=Amblyraja radiata TaxID=386614 RepID=UPI001403BAE6|nr:uncharacterized protein LOC116985293 [Amblyraja radiata]